MANLGLIEELVSSPSIWLCVSCGRCTRACSQLVRGHSFIGQLQEMALARGIVHRRFRERFHEKSRVLFSNILDRIDGLTGLA